MGEAAHFGPYQTKTAAEPNRHLAPSGKQRAHATRRDDAGIVGGIEIQRASKIEKEFNIFSPFRSRIEHSLYLVDTLPKP